MCWCDQCTYQFVIINSPTNRRNWTKFTLSRRIHCKFLWKCDVKWKDVKNIVSKCQVFISMRIKSRKTKWGSNTDSVCDRKWFILFQRGWVVSSIRFMWIQLLILGLIRTKASKWNIIGIIHPHNVNTFKPELNWWHFPGDIFRCIFGQRRYLYWFKVRWTLYICICMTIS